MSAVMSNWNQLLIYSQEIAYVKLSVGSISSVGGKLRKIFQMKKKKNLRFLGNDVKSSLSSQNKKKHDK